MSALSLTEDHSYFSADPFNVLQSIEEPLESEHFTSSSSTYTRKNSNSKPSSSSSDCASSPEALQNATRQVKKYPVCSDLSAVDSASNSTIGSEEKLSKAPLVNTTITATAASKMNFTHATTAASNTVANSNGKKEASTQAGSKNGKSYSSVVSTGVKAKVKPTAPVAPEKLSNKLDISRVITNQDARTTFMIRNIPNKYTQVSSHLNPKKKRN